MGKNAFYSINNSAKRNNIGKFRAIILNKKEAGNNVKGIASQERTANRCLQNSYEQRQADASEGCSESVTFTAENIILTVKFGNKEAKRPN